MKEGDVVKRVNSVELGIITKRFLDGELEIKFTDGIYALPESSLELVESSPELKKPVRRKQAVFQNYKVGHNMRPYLPQVIYEIRPDLKGLFTEKEKSNYHEVTNAKEWLKQNPAFLTMIDGHVERHGREEISIQIFVELYRWGFKELKTVVAAFAEDTTYAQAREEQQRMWATQEEEEKVA